MILRRACGTACSVLHDAWAKNLNCCCCRTGQAAWHGHTADQRTRSPHSQSDLSFPTFLGYGKSHHHTRTPYREMGRWRVAFRRLEARKRAAGPHSELSCFPKRNLEHSFCFVDLGGESNLRFLRHTARLGRQIQIHPSGDVIAVGRQDLSGYGCPASTTKMVAHTVRLSSLDKRELRNHPGVQCVPPAVRAPRTTRAVALCPVKSGALECVCVCVCVCLSPPPKRGSGSARAGLLSALPMQIAAAPRFYFLCA